MVENLSYANVYAAFFWNTLYMRLTVH